MLNGNKTVSQIIHDSMLFLLATFRKRQVYDVIYQIEKLFYDTKTHAKSYEINKTHCDMTSELSTSLRAFNNMFIVTLFQSILKQEKVPVSFCVVSETANRCLLVWGDV